MAKTFLLHITPPFIIKIYNKGRFFFQYLRAKKLFNQFNKLHLGCGGNILNGWTNIDLKGNDKVIAWDLTNPLPVKSESVKFIYSEHFIEHITYDQAKNLLHECYRILQPQGVLRISTPNLVRLIDNYMARKITEFEDMGWSPATPCQMVNEGMRLWGHMFVYDPDELTRMLKDIGFRKIDQVGWRESEFRELKNLESRPFKGEIILEAIK